MGGVMVGVAVLIVVTSVMDGFQERVRSVLRGNLSHILVAPKHGQRLRDLATFSHELKAAEPRIIGVAPQVTAPLGYFHRGMSGVRIDDQALSIMSGVGLDWETERAIEAERARLGESLQGETIRIVVANDPKDPFESPRVNALKAHGTDFEKFPV